MKKTISFIIAIVFLLGSVTAGAYTDEQKTDIRSDEMKGLLSALGITPEFGGEYVSRGEFIVTAAELLKLPEGDAPEQLFNDVDVSGKLGAAVYYAERLGIISAGERFEPDRAVTYGEACKMMINVLGYNRFALSRGDYPTGYVMQAEKLKLGRGLSKAVDALLTPDEFYIFLRNSVEANAYSISGIEDTGVYFSRTYREEGTLLEIYHNVHEFSGILQGNSVSYLYDEEQELAENTVIIDSEYYEYDNQKGLGMKAGGFYAEENGVKKILYMQLAENNILKLEADSNPIFTENTVKYYDGNGRQKSVRLNQGVILLYNGKADKYQKLENIKISDGFIELIDNNNDNAYECVSIWEKSFLIADKIDVSDSIIYDSNRDTVIDLSDSDVIYTVNGKKMALADIVLGSCIEYTVSKDGRYYDIVTADKTIQGIVSGMGTGSEAELIVDGIKYKCTEYYKRNYLNAVNIGAEIKAYISGEGRLIANISYSDGAYRYGFLYKAAAEDKGISGEKKVRIFSQDGTDCIYTLRSKVKLNGEVKTDDYVINMLIAGGEQLVRYDPDDNGKIKALNTESEITGVFDSSTDDQNLLKRYRYYNDESNAKMYYKNTGFFATYFMVDDSTKIFRVYGSDTEPEPSKRFTVCSPGTMLVSTPNIPLNGIKAFNVGADGYAQAVVFYTEPDMNSFTRSDWGVVSEVFSGLDSDGETSIGLQLYCEDRYETFFIKRDSEFLETLSSGYEKSEIPFAAGDVVRYIADADGYIRNCTKDFDRRTETVNYFSSNDYNSINYYYGTLMYAGSRSVAILRKEDNGTERTVYYPFNLTKYCFVSSKDDEVLTYPRNKLMGYTQNGGKEYKVLLRCEDATAKQLIFFDNVIDSVSVR